MPVFIELSGVKARYHAPLMRTVVFGKIDPGILELSKYSNDCIETIIESCKDGVLASEIAKKAEKIIKPIRDKILFHDLYAYPVGIAFPPNWIENPNFYLSHSNDNKIRKGMVFHLPLTLRINGKYGAGFSETIIIKEEGAEKLSNLPRTLNPELYKLN